MQRPQCFTAARTARRQECPSTAIKIPTYMRNEVALGTRIRDPEIPTQFLGFLGSRQLHPGPALVLRRLVRLRAKVAELIYIPRELVELIYRNPASTKPWHNTIPSPRFHLYVHTTVLRWEL